MTETHKEHLAPEREKCEIEGCRYWALVFGRWCPGHVALDWLSRV